jgi:poly(hydroxyalkanoate) depolymerase family esterase
MRTSFHHQSEAQPPNGPLTAATSPDTPISHAQPRSQVVALWGANNQNACFNWFEPDDTSRDRGEALSIRQMIDAVERYSVDRSRVYVVGLSAGGAMAAAMLAAYPERFAGGAIVAGVPYGCADSISKALQCMNPGIDQSPAEWRRRVRCQSSRP